MEERKYIDAGTYFKNRHFSGELIIGCMRWYLKYLISYRNLEEMMQERGVEVDYTTIYRWIQKYAAEFHKRISWYSQVYSGSWRVDETYIKVKGKWKYLYRVINKYGKTIDFILLHRRDKEAAKRFLKKALKSSKSNFYRINTDKHAPYQLAINELRKE
ncbi:Transposase for insertion sequence-like element IS431mec [Rickettsiales endosymbiont of Trichoplax sp. H2]|nr:Transposase for insertion sequence-like element IS431mec [Rickettsiales endosymbiont of Trichoplax sp. H2]